MRWAPIFALLLAGCAPKHITGSFARPIGAYPLPRIGYKVYRGTTLGNMEPVFTVSTETFRDATAQPGVKYYYKVTAVYADGSESDPTNIQCGTTTDGQVQCGP
jgi:hypothetical protein